MQSDNDNFRNDAEFIIAKAAQAVHKCGLQTEHHCPLSFGGSCPIVNNIIENAKTE